MCDNDYSYEPISDRMVVTRKVHECACCMKDFPKGSKMRVAVGLTDGELGRTYNCSVCEWAFHQPDHSPLHLCWGWNWDGADYPDGEETWNYINACLHMGVTPTEGHLKLHLQNVRDSEAGP